ncbi:MAG: exonuclease [Pseudomonadota bacterium]
MPEHCFIFDCEFLTAEGSPSRFWCGPKDPDPIVVQIGIVKLSLELGFDIEDRLQLFIEPIGRNGQRVALDPFFTRLTGITEEMLDAEGQSLDGAFVAVKDFIGSEKLWSWGKDELNLVAISCYIQGISPALPAHRFGNACDLFLKAGMPYDDLKKTRSNMLADYYGIERPELKGHDALDDALSVSYALQHVLREGLLTADQVQ